MMERGPSKTPLSLLIIIIIIIAAIHLEAFEQTKTFHYVGEEKNWREARKYCMKNYHDLASVSVEEIDQRDDFRNIKASDDDAWIGLYRDPKNIFVWRWTGGSGDASSDTNWATGEPEMTNCTRLKGRLWYSVKCSTAFHFYCSDEDNVEYVKRKMSWLDAQESCAKRSMVLATVTLSNHKEFARSGWIGLHLPPKKHIWKWTAKDSDYRNWAEGQPTHDDCGFFSFPTNRWQSTRCSLRLPFVCENNPVRDPDLVLLVTENKTWEQALEHCRDIGADSSSSQPDDDDHYGDHQYDLASLQSKDDHRHARDRIQEATTNEVWTALRFLAGEWLWVDGQPQRYENLPLCPAWGRHCGTLPKEDLTAQWQIRDCMERRNFLCMKTPAKQPEGG